jgi:hypothetical protein
MWKYRRELIRRREVNWIIQSWVRTNSALKAPSCPIDLAEQLNLQPALITLDSLYRYDGTGKLSDTNKTDASN